MQEISNITNNKDANIFIKEYSDGKTTYTNTEELRPLVEIISVENRHIIINRINGTVGKIDCDCVLTKRILEENLMQNKLQPLDGEQAAIFMLQTHLQYFTKYGMNPDELIFILDNHPNYKDINYKRNLVDINQDNIRNIKKPKDRDFEMFPILEEGHWITGFIHFDQNGKQIGYYTFDSDIKRESRETSHKDISLKQDGSTQVLNDKNLQGNSNLCWLFTLECMRIVNCNYKDFKSLKNNMFELKRKIDTKMDVTKNIYFQQMVYNQVNKTLSNNNCSLDLNKLSDGRSRSKLVGGNGYGKEHDLIQVESEYKREKIQSNNAVYPTNIQQTNINITPDTINTNKNIQNEILRKRQQQAEQKFIERFKSARENRERMFKKYSITYYRESSIYRNKKLNETWTTYVDRSQGNNNSNGRPLLHP